MSETVAYPNFPVFFNNDRSFGDFTLKIHPIDPRPRVLIARPILMVAIKTVYSIPSKICNFPILRKAGNKIGDAYTIIIMLRATRRLEGGIVPLVYLSSVKAPTLCNMLMMICILGVITLNGFMNELRIYTHISVLIGYFNRLSLQI